MLVKEMIQAIVNKELKVSELATQYGFSDRTIQVKIKKLGFEWMAKEAKYKFVGTDQTVLELPIDEVFKAQVPVRKSGKNEGKNRGEINIESASDININRDSKIERVRDSEKTMLSNSKNNDKNNSDNIDRLLAGKKAKKEYKGFYIDSDVLSVLDSVDNGVKSELVNECLRKVFREKGLL